MTTNTLESPITPFHIDRTKLWNIFRLIVTIAMAVPFAVAFVQFVLTGWNSRFLQDDYGMMAIIQHRTLLDTIIYRYETWTGRFSWVALEYVLIKLFGFHAAQVTASSLLILFAASTFCVARLVFGKIESFLLSLALVDTIISICTLGGSAGFYWFSANTGYLPAIIIAILAIPRLLSKLHASSKELVIFGIISFVCAGFNEMVSFSILSLLLFWLTYTKGRNRRVIIVTACLVIGFLVMAAAPGNHNRKLSEHSAFLTPTQIITTVEHLTSDMISLVLPIFRIHAVSVLDLPTITMSGKLLLGVLNIIAFALVLGLKLPLDLRHLIWLLLAFATALYCSMAVAVYGTGGLLLQRMMLIPYFLIAMMSIISSALFAELSKRITYILPKAVIGIFFSYCMLAPVSYGLIVFPEISNNYLKISTITALQWDTQANSIKQALNNTETILTNLPIVKNWFPEADPIGRDSLSYTNSQAAIVYHVKGLFTR